jgi:amidase
MSSTSSPDPYGAFLPYPDVPVTHAAAGPLAGLRLGVKDLFDVAGYPTGCGNPLKLEQSETAAESAPPVQALLDASMTFAGKTHLDELAYSTNGVNHHYGAPVNANAPGRVTGGSSSGSAAAVAADLVDVGLGSDTGGSVRLPASYCGLFGIRPSHGAISLERAMPLAPSFDTVGWLTQSAALLRKVGDVLLPPDGVDRGLARLLVADGAFGLLDDAARAAFAPVLDKIRAHFEDVASAVLFPDGTADRRPVFRTAQGYEAWQAHGPWITRYQPEMGADVAGRFRLGSAVSREDYNAATKARVSIRAFLDDLLGADGMVLLPATVTSAPTRDSSGPALEEVRNRVQQLLCIASLTGHPQISIPAGRVEGAPIGLSIIGPRGSDRALLRWTERLSEILFSGMDGADNSVGRID